jgi:hypothetical protein
VVTASANVVAYAYPWDLIDDPAAAERIAGLGVDSVALAAAYHTVRAATPMHPRHRVIDARHAALYLPVRPEVWRGARLVPATPGWMRGPDSFGTARDALGAVGLPVHAWTVLTHCSRLGAAHPELAVHNAFGDIYPYALCPANSDVREYCRTLAGEIVHCGQPDGLVIEACGPLGFAHGGHHEKTDGADWGGVRQRLLDLCFCTGCQHRYTAAGLDGQRLRELVRSGVDGAPSDTEDALGEDVAAAVADVRTGLAAELRATVLDAIRSQPGRRPVVLHASADPWSTGPFATVAPTLAYQADALVVSCWAGPQQGTANLAALGELAGPDVTLGAYVLALPPRAADAGALTTEWSAYLDAGASELHVYHAGLASQDRLTAIRDALATLRSH